jgi:serine/threonine-protein kinase
MADDALTACWNSIPPAKRQTREHLDRRLARQAVQSQALTLWQAQQLLAGRTSGYKVDRYILLDLIGQGGMGRVYLARDTRLNRRVALKILSPERMNNPRAIARFQREARVGAQLQHENLVRIYDFGESNGRYYLVMEYIEGKTIGTLLAEQGPMPPATAVRLVCQVALGLEHAHRKGLIHRDVNPYNILVTHDGTAKLADLGLAIDLADQDRVTRDGATVGTFDYVAPEQARQSHSADIRSDIYSLGCTLYHMISGQVPFPSPSLPEKLFAHQALQPTRLDQLVLGLPDGLADLIHRMMHKCPDERHASPLLVAQALAPYIGEVDHLGNEDTSPVVKGDGRSLPISRNAADPVALELKGAAPKSEITSPPVDLGSRRDPDRATLATDPGTTATNAPTPPVPLPAQDSQTSDSDFPLNLNLGPEPFLTGRLANPKPRLGAVFGTGLTPATHPASVAKHPQDLRLPKGVLGFPLPPPPVWGLVALTVIAATIAIIVASRQVLSTIPVKRKTLPQSSHLRRVEPDSLHKSSTEPDEPKRSADGQEIVVRTIGEGEKDRVFPNLLEAMNTAMGTRDSWVELRSRQPLRLSAEQAIELNSGRGRLAVRAAEGFAPVIEFELTGARPLLTTGSALSLELAGLTIIARSPRIQGASIPASPPPLIRTAGNVTLKRCAFKVAGRSPLKGSRAVHSDGGKLTVDRCWFEGFDEAIDLATLSDTTADVAETMIVVPSLLSSNHEPSSDSYGWGLKLQIGSERRSKLRPHLRLESCTVEGAGLLELVDRQHSTPFFVEIRNCVVRAEALLSWHAKTPLDRLDRRLQWLGKGNHYEILGHSWIVQSARQGTPALSNEITDLESWLRAFRTESDPVRANLNYYTSAAARSSVLRPREFAVDTSALGHKKLGADPDLVGPWSKP